MAYNLFSLSKNIQVKQNGYLDYYPQLQHLIFILKKFIYTSKLFGPYKGGLSSYGLILMIIAYIQHYYKQCERQNKDISQILTADLLIGFLKFYGFTMNYVMKSINICNIENPLEWKNYTRCDNPYVDPLNPISVFILLHRIYNPNQ